MKKEKFNQPYFIGIQIESDSVGYAVTDNKYNLCKYSREALWGASLFNEAENQDKRRAFRSDRRRLNRKQQRIDLLQELFAIEIAKVDPDFFLRLNESGLRVEDKTNSASQYSLFSDKTFTDKHYYQKYPTIHHLICDLMENTQPHDVRLVYLACAWLISHRGHFNENISMKNDGQLDFDSLYQRFKDYFVKAGYDLPWCCETEEIESILTNRSLGVTAKEKALAQLVNNGKKLKNTATESFPYGKAALARILFGGKASLSELFQNESYKELGSFVFGDEKAEELLLQLGNDAELIELMQAMHDSALLTSLMSYGGEKVNTISAAKVKIYEQHKKDLQQLRKFVRKYRSEVYSVLFNDLDPELPNYPAYSYHFKLQDAPVKELPKKKASQEEFCDFLKGLFTNCECDEEDHLEFVEMMTRIENLSFMPKQKSTENRIIPCQLYLSELKTILTNAAEYLPFLKEKGTDGLSVSDKIVSIFLFKIPYFIGPLNSKSQFAWIVRKGKGRIYPWNFEKIVDFDKSEQEFISRMMGKCSYIPGAPALPRQSLKYNLFVVLNNLNNLRIDGKKPSVEAKQYIVTELFSKQKKVTIKQIREAIIRGGFMEKNQILSGLDTPINFSLDSYVDFIGMMREGKLNENDVEKIISHSTATTSLKRQQQWIDQEFPSLSESDRRYLGRLKYQAFGNLSKELLEETIGMDRRTGQKGSVLYFLWNTNQNLSELFSDRYTFKDEIELFSQEYYKENPSTLEERLSDSYISNKSARPLLNATAIISDIIKAQGREPEKIFINSLSFPGSNPGKKTITRKEKILEAYKRFPSNEVSELLKELESLGDNANNQLQNDALFLYFMQLGCCMYTGNRIPLSRLYTDYNKDHIYPKSIVIDESINNNIVLVKMDMNKTKDDSYPISEDIQEKMMPFWTKLRDKEMISSEKFNRLTRRTQFQPEEKIGFIVQQTMAVNNAVKILTKYLSEIYPDTKVITAKENLVSAFRGQFDLTRIRSANESYHAKDAYLNIIVGNIYYERFNRKFFSVNQKYSINPYAVFTHDVVVDGKEIWNPERDLPIVKKNFGKNKCRFVRKTITRKGLLFKMNPLKAGMEKSLAPRKKGLDPNIYGGYPSVSTAFFVLVKAKFKKEDDLVLVPVQILARKVMENEYTANEYLQKQLDQLFSGKADLIGLPLGLRPLLPGTTIELDQNIRLSLAGKTNTQLSMGLMIPLNIPEEQARYIRKLEKVWAKKAKNPKYLIDPVFDRITTHNNLLLYDFLTQKANALPFAKIPRFQGEALVEGRKCFAGLDVNVQAAALRNILYLFQMRRSGACDLSAIGGAKNTAIPIMSMRLSRWRKTYTDVRIVDISPSGIFEQKSMNLLELLD